MNPVDCSNAVVQCTTAFFAAVAAVTSLMNRRLQKKIDRQTNGMTKPQSKTFAVDREFRG